MAHFRFSGVSERTRRTNSDAVEAEAESEGAAGAEAANGEDNGATVSSCGGAEGGGGDEWRDRFWVSNRLDLHGRGKLLNIVAAAAVGLDQLQALRLDILYYTMRLLCV